MSLQLIEQFLFWCGLINTGMLMISFIMILFMKRLIFKTHGKMFGLDEDFISKALYTYVGFYKILIFMFNIIPFIAVKIISG